MSFIDRIQIDSVPLIKNEVTSTHDTKMIKKEKELYILEKAIEELAQK